MKLSKAQCLARAEVYEARHIFLCNTDWTDDPIEREQGIKIALEMQESAMYWYDKADKRK